MSISLMSSSIILGNPAVGYIKENSEKPPGADINTNNTSNNNNSSPQFATIPAQACNNGHNKSACQEQHQLMLKQQPDQKQQQQLKPDNSCLFHPEQVKCKPDPITGKCPKGFSMNVYEHCFPNIRCPTGFENHDEDETGTCYPILKPNSAHISVSK